MSAGSQDRKCREISNPKADLQLIAPVANREPFKSRFAKARKMNVSAERRELCERPSPADCYASPDLILSYASCSVCALVFWRMAASYSGISGVCIFCIFTEIR